MLRRAAEAGVSVPHPVEHTGDGLMMEFIGDETQAAPKLAQARLSDQQLASAWTQLLRHWPRLMHREHENPRDDRFARDFMSSGSSPPAWQALHVALYA